MPIWTFVRHGESVANAGRWFAGSTDVPLTDAGMAQAATARAGLSKTPFTRAIASDLQRARHTAEILLSGTTVPLRVSPKLRERDCGKWERRPFAEVEDEGSMAAFHAWTEAPPGGESLREVARRALTFLAAVDTGEHTLVVAHGALIRAVVGVVDGTPADRIGLWKPENCQLIPRTLPVGRFATVVRALP